MTLITAGVFAPFRPDGGTRIHTAGRLTMSDGETKHPLLKVGVGFDLWWPELAPDGPVYWEYSQKRIDWARFEELYLEKLRSDNEARMKMAELAGMAMRGNATVTCMEEEPHRCHRRLLAEQMLVKFPSLQVDLDGVLLGRESHP